MIIRFKSYIRGSRGLHELSLALRDLGHRSYSYSEETNMVGSRNTADNLVINWGCSRNWELINSIGQGIIFNHRQLNPPVLVGLASNKLRCFRHLSTFNNVQLVDFTTDHEQARGWILDGHTVVERHNLNGHSGDGIRIVEPNGLLTGAPLYTKYKKKKHEFRVHVFNGSVIDIQQKRLSRGENPNLGDAEYKVRNRANGWVYCRDDIQLSNHGIENIGNIAVNTINNLGLTFGAVDIIYNSNEDHFYVLEVNTAVGLQGTTAEKYAVAIDSYIRSL